MRKALLVVALVFASFAGGAVVNGPGLTWLKGLIGDRLHRGDAIPTLDVDDGPPVAVVDAEPSPAPAPAPVATATATAKPASPAPEDAPPTLAPTKTDPPADPPADSHVANEPNPLPLPELPASAAPAPEPAKSIGKTPTPARATGWEDAPGSAPSSAVLPRSRPARDRAPTADPAVAAATGVPVEPPPLTSSPPAGSPNPDDWPALRKRMKALGVAKYWVEGTPGGSVTFRCVAHPAGPDSADRQFEAEADDESQAAESALRRVAVWRAAERVKG